MFTTFHVALSLRCSASSLNVAPASYRHQARSPFALKLTARSTETAAVEIPGPSSSSSDHTGDILKHVSKGSRQQLAACDANTALSDAEQRSLLLRIAAFHYLWCRFHADADPTLCDINNMVSKIVVMTRVLAGGSSQHVLQTIERHPPVIAQPTKLLFERMVRIKQLIPQSDVSLVVAKRPSLLCMETGVLASKVNRAAQQLRALMPAVPWETRLIQDSNLWLTFVTLLDDHKFAHGVLGGF